MNLPGSVCKLIKVVLWVLTVVAVASSVFPQPLKRSNLGMYSYTDQYLPKIGKIRKKTHSTAPLGVHSLVYMLDVLPRIILTPPRSKMSYSGDNFSKENKVMIRNQKLFFENGLEKRRKNGVIE